MSTTPPASGFASRRNRERSFGHRTGAPGRDQSSDKPSRSRGAGMFSDTRRTMSIRCLSAAKTWSMTRPASPCTYRIAFGPRAGQKVLTLQSVPNRMTPSTSPRCVNEQGFSLHAEVRLAINQRHKLEHLCCYITRPAIANERLQRNGEGQVVLQLKSPYHDGTTHIVMEPLEFLASASPRSCPVPGCISSASMACSPPMPSSVPRSSQTRRLTWLTTHRATVRHAIPRRRRA